MVHVQLPPLKTPNDGIGGVNMITPVILDLLEKVLTAEGPNAWTFLKSYRTEVMSALLRTHGEGTPQAEHEAVDYGLRAMSAIFDAIETKFDENKVFQKDQ